MRRPGRLIRPRSGCPAGPPVPNPQLQRRVAPAAGTGPSRVGHRTACTRRGAARTRSAGAVAVRTATDDESPVARLANEGCPGRVPWFAIRCRIAGLPRHPAGCLPAPGWRLTRRAREWTRVPGLLSPPHQRRLVPERLLLSSCRSIWLNVLGVLSAVLAAPRDYPVLLTRGSPDPRRPGAACLACLAPGCPTGAGLSPRRASRLGLRARWRAVGRPGPTVRVVGVAAAFQPVPRPGGRIRECGQLSAHVLCVPVFPPDRLRPPRNVWLRLSGARFAWERYAGD